MEINIEDSWTCQYELCMHAYKFHAELQNVTGILTLPRCDHLLERAKTEVEKAEIYILLDTRYEVEVIFFMFFYYYLFI